MQTLGVLTSPRLSRAGFRHAFFTRQGGFSSGPFASLNFSVSVGDDPAHVSRNFALAGEVLGVPAAHVCHLNQVHGDHTVSLLALRNHEEVAGLEGDALVSNVRGLACGVRTADCVPVLLADTASGAAGAVHVGWRGAVAGVLKGAVSSLWELDSGSTQGRGRTGHSAIPPNLPSIIAAIGPHISARAFEVGVEVAEQLERAAPGASAVDRDSFDKPHVDLRKIIHFQLRELGIHAIDDVLGCTFFDEELYFSYRRSGPKSGRHLSAIVPTFPANAP